MTWPVAMGKVDEPEPDAVGKRSRTEPDKVEVVVTWVSEEEATLHCEGWVVKVGKDGQKPMLINSSIQLGLNSSSPLG